ncbi:MAG TPA: O-methyltransferase [Nitrososphaerales archaeon]|nr:O-methyltransferase [Nitrososphaerales archaeon]
MTSDSAPGITTLPVEKYLNGLLRPRDKVLIFLEKDAEKNGVPIVGPLEGNFLSLVAMSCKAKNILEVGTATGYSGIWLGRVAKQNGGKLTTIESDPSRVKIAAKSFRDAGLSDSIDIITGDAREELPKIAKSRAGRFEVVFLDVGDKGLYVDLLDDCVKALHVGGFLLADNTLWRGLVAVSAADRDATTIREFNKRIYADRRLFPSIIPLRDGVAVALKISEK